MSTIRTLADLDNCIKYRDSYLKALKQWLAGEWVGVYQPAPSEENIASAIGSYAGYYFWWAEQVYDMCEYV